MASKTIILSITRYHWRARCVSVMAYVHEYVKHKYGIRILIRMRQEPKKQKLTLSVDKDVVEKARKLGINISEITEKILRGFTFTPSTAERDTLYEKYKQLFNAMLPLLQKYAASVEVGGEYDEKVGPMPILLLSNGNFWIDVFENEINDIQAFAITDFYEPKMILANFIKALSNAAERHKQTLAELEMARRIIDAIGGTSGKRSSGTASLTKRGKKSR